MRLNPFPKQARTAPLEPKNHLAPGRYKAGKRNRRPKKTKKQAAEPTQRQKWTPNPQGTGQLTETSQSPAGPELLTREKNDVDALTSTTSDWLTQRHARTGPPDTETLTETLTEYALLNPDGTTANGAQEKLNTDALT